MDPLDHHVFQPCLFPEVRHCSGVSEGVDGPAVLGFDVEVLQDPLVALHQLVNDGVVGSGGFVRHHPSATHYLQLTVLYQSPHLYNNHTLITQSIIKVPIIKTF